MENEGTRLRGRPGGTVSDGICRVLACPVKMLILGMNGDGESVGGQLTQVYLEDCH